MGLVFIVQQNGTGVYSADMGLVFIVQQHGMGVYSATTLDWCL